MTPRRGRWVLLLLPFLAGCATTRVVRLDTGTGSPLEYTPSSWNESVDVGEDDFKIVRGSRLGIPHDAPAVAPAAGLRTADNGLRVDDTTAQPRNDLQRHAT